MAKKCEHQRIKSTCSTCSVESVYRAYKYKAERQRHLSFTLTQAQFEAVIQRPCWWCNEIDMPRGLDRVRNDQGYLPENVVSCCGTCNKIKGTFEHLFLFQHIGKMYRHTQKKSQLEILQPVIGERKREAA